MAYGLKACSCHPLTEQSLHCNADVKDHLIFGQSKQDKKNMLNVQYEFYLHKTYDN